MGSNIAINKEHISRYRTAEDLKCMGAGGCFMAISRDVSCIAKPRCKENKCFIDKKDSSVCEERKDPDDCYFRFAIENEDTSYCDRISNERVKFVTKEHCVRIAAKQQEGEP